MSKNKKKVKKVVICFTVIAGLALVGGGVYHFVPGVRDMFHPTEQIQASSFKTSYLIEGRVMGDTMTVRGYYGEDSQFALPQTVSLGDLVAHRYNFTSLNDLEQYYDTIYQRYADSEGWNGDTSQERFKYSFLSANDTLFVAKSLDELQQGIQQIRDMSEEERNEVFPMRHDGVIQSFKEGADIRVTNIEKLSSNVTAVHIPVGVNCDYRELASQGIVLSFDANHTEFGSWYSANGCLIDKATQTLKYVYPCELVRNTYATVKGLKAIDFSAFESIVKDIKILNISEGVVAVSGSLNAFETSQNITINMPKSLQTINTSNLVERENSRNNVIVHLHSLPTYPRGAGIEAYRFARADYNNPTYILTDDLYNKLITDLPEFRNSSYAEQLVSYSIYLSRN